MKGRAILFFGAALATAANADIVSRFDTGTEGWLSANVSFPGLTVLETHAPTWSNGYIGDTEASFTQSGLFVLAAPSKFLGNLSSALNGNVYLRLSDTQSDGINYPNLLLRGNGIALGYRTVVPAIGGTDYKIPLKAAGWTTLAGNPATDAQFLSAISNLDVFAINADWTTNGTDVITLDNVVVSPVPEPTTWAAMGLGLMALTRRRQRSRSK